MVVLLSPRLTQPLAYDMRNEQICKTINISGRLVSVNIIGDYNF